MVALLIGERLLSSGWLVGGGCFWRPWLGLKTLGKTEVRVRVRREDTTETRKEGGGNSCQNAGRRWMVSFLLFMVGPSVNLSMFMFHRLGHAFFYHHSSQANTFPASTHLLRVTGRASRMSCQNSIPSSARPWHSEICSRAGVMCQMRLRDLCDRIVSCRDRGGATCVPVLSRSRK